MVTMNADAYQNALEQILKRGTKQKSIAEAQGIGEAQRRGLISPTGTSDIEMALRQSKVQPVQESMDQALANVLMEKAGREWQTGERLGSQEWQTGERKGTQDWRTGERIGSQDWQSDEARRGRIWSGKMAGYIDPTTGTETGGYYKDGQYVAPEWTQPKWTSQTDITGQKHYGGQLDAFRNYLYGLDTAQRTKPKRKKWYEGLAGGVGQGLGTAGTLWGLGQMGLMMSDKRSKKNIKPANDTIDKLKVKKYEYRTDKKFDKFNLPKGEQVGLIAQELEKVVPKAVEKHDGYRMVNYTEIIPLLVNTVKDIKSELKEVKTNA